MGIKKTPAARFPEEWRDSFHGHTASCLSLVGDDSPTTSGHRVEPHLSADEQAAGNPLRAFEPQGDDTPEVTVRTRKGVA